MAWQLGALLQWLVVCVAAPGNLGDLKKGAGDGHADVCPSSASYIPCRSAGAAGAAAAPTVELGRISTWKRPDMSGWSIVGVDANPQWPTTAPSFCASMIRQHPTQLNRLHLPYELVSNWRNGYNSSDKRCVSTSSKSSKNRSSLWGAPCSSNDITSLLVIKCFRQQAIEYTHARTHRHHTSRHDSHYWNLSYQSIGNRC